MLILSSFCVRFIEDLPTRFPQIVDDRAFHESILAFSHTFVYRVANRIGDGGMYLPTSLS